MMESCTLTTPKNLKEQLQASSSQIQFVKKAQTTIKNIIQGWDDRLLLVVGPCSIHDVSGAKEYAFYLKELIEQVKDTFFVVMRTYLEKPRTSTGWKGYIYDPFLDETHHMHIGLTLSRQLLLDLAELEIPTATEFLDPTLHHYFSDLISWGCIGARTVTSPIHRQLASCLPMPMGFKNPIDGEILTAVHAISVASHPHTFMGCDDSGNLVKLSSQGNHCPHLILRGGKHQPNYDTTSIKHAYHLLQEAQAPSKVIVDCSHDNSKKNIDKQEEVFSYLIHHHLKSNLPLSGLMLESYLEEGKQSCIPRRVNGRLSITDPCLGWERTQKLVLDAHEKIKKKKDSLKNSSQSLSSL